MLTMTTRCSWAWALLVVLMCAPAQAQSLPSVLVLALKNKVLSNDKAETLSELMVVAVTRAGKFQVITPEDVSAQFEQSKMRELVGCDAVKCAADIGGALGTRYLLTGSVRKLGKRLFINLSLIDTQEQNVRRGSGEVEDDESMYARAIDQAVAELLTLAPAVRAVTPPAPTPALSPGTAGPVLFLEDFRDNSRKWPVWPEGTYYNADIKDGQYLIETKNDKCSMEMVPVPSLLPADVDIEWRTTWHKGVQNSGYGLVLGTTRADYYTFGASGNGQTVVWLSLKEVNEPDLMPWRTDTALRGDAGKVSNSHKLEIRSGKYLAYYTNGVLLTRFAAVLDLTSALVGFRVCDLQRAGLSGLVMRAAKS